MIWRITTRCDYNNATSMLHAYYMVKARFSALNK